MSLDEFDVFLHVFPVLGQQIPDQRPQSPQRRVRGSEMHLKQVFFQDQDSSLFLLDRSRWFSHTHVKCVNKHILKTHMFLAETSRFFHCWAILRTTLRNTPTPGSSTGTRLASLSTDWCMTCPGFSLAAWCGGLERFGVRCGQRCLGFCLLMIGWFVQVPYYRWIASCFYKTGWVVSIIPCSCSCSCYHFSTK